MSPGEVLNQNSTLGRANNHLFWIPLKKNLSKIRPDVYLVLGIELVISAVHL